MGHKQIQKKRVFISISTDGEKLDTAVSFKTLNMATGSLLIMEMEQLKLEILQILKDVPSNYEITEGDGKEEDDEGR